MLLAVALNSATIFINIVGTNTIWDRFIIDFPLGILTVIITILYACIFSKFLLAIRQLSSAAGWKNIKSSLLL